jgi:uncharacterized protein YodC (DUF2158 family)
MFYLNVKKFIMEIQVGSEVRLSNGGPWMVVEKVETGDVQNNVICVWEDDEGNHQQAFSSLILITRESEKKENPEWDGKIKQNRW